MRILLIDHLPLGDSPDGEETLRLARGLRNLAHEVNCLVADALPTFSAATPGASSFLDLTDRQIASYRESTRRQLDREVLARDPQIIHAQYVGLLGHLALETGVPYVLSTRGTELQVYRRDRRWRRFADEAVAGAGRVLADDERVERELLELFPHAAERIAVLPPAEGSHGPWIARIAAIYEAVLRERFGSDTADG